MKIDLTWRARAHNLSKFVIMCNNISYDKSSLIPLLHVEVNIDI